MQRVIDLGTINPNKLTEMTDEQNWVLAQFLQKRAIGTPRNAFVKETEQCTILLEIENEFVSYMFKISEEILIGEREHVKGEYRFHTIERDPKAPKGVYGVVPKIKTTLGIEDDCLVLLTKKRRVKIQQHRPDKLEKAKAEYLRTKQAPHTHVKEPVIKQNSNPNPRSGNSYSSYTVMRDLGDMDVEVLTLDVGPAKSLSITLDQLIELSILLLFGLDDQVFKNDLYHRDIKPANIRITKDFLQAFFLDFGLSVKASEKKDYHSKGTPFFMAPERFREFSKDRSANEKTEIYEFFVALAELWRIENFRNNCVTDYDLDEMFDNRSPTLNLDFNKNRNGKFFGGLDKQQVAEILNLFAQATDYDPNKRPQVANAINVFESIRLARLFKTEEITDETVKKSIENANQDARIIIDEMKSMQKNPRTDAFDLLRRYISEFSKNYTNFACREFIHRLGVRAFIGLTSSKEITEKLEEISIASNKNIRPLSALCEKIDIIRSGDFSNDATQARVEKLYKDLVRAKNKYVSKGADIDELIALNDRISTSLPVYAKLIERLEFQINLDNLLQNKPEINQAADFLSKRAKACGYSAFERKNMRKDFLEGIAAEFINEVPLSKLITENKINYLIEFYTHQMHLTHPEMASDFKKLLKANIQSLSDQDKQNEKFVMHEISKTKKFMSIKVKLMGILFDECHRLENLKDSKNKMHLEFLEYICDLIDSAFNIEVIPKILSQIPDSLMQCPHVFGMYKTVSPFDKAMKAFKKEYLSEVVNQVENTNQRLN